MSAAQTDHAPSSSAASTVEAPDAAIQAWREADVLVALTQARFVLGLLHEAGVRDTAVTTDEGLDLARLRIPDPADAVEKVSRLAGLSSPPPHPADAVIAGLRALSAARYGGWQPELGKNRLVDRVGGVNGIVIHGDEAGPAITDSSLPTRAAGRGRGVTVGIVDGPVSDHPWFAGAVEFGYADAVSTAGTDAPRATAGHATFVSGLVLAQAPSATVRACAALGLDGTADAWDVATRIVALGNSGVDVLNLSFGCFTGDDRPPMVLRQAIARIDPRVVIVAAAGNHDPESGLRRRPFWPAAFGRVIAVGAVSQRNGVLTTAAFSPALPWVDVEAPGVDALSTYLQAAELGDGSTADFDGWARWQGTSFAAAVVSGMIARAVVPGRVSALQACADLLGALRAGEQPGGARVCRSSA